MSRVRLKRRDVLGSVAVRLPFCLLWLPFCPASAEVSVSNVNEAIVRMEKRKSTDWAYTQTVTRDKQVSVSRYDPRKPDAVHGWTLLRMNDNAPSAKESKKFYRDIEKRAEKSDQAENPAPPLSELIRTESLKPLRVDANGRMVFGFVPRIKDLDDVLLGELAYNPERSGIDRIRVWNPEDYAPAFSINVSDFSMEFSFDSLGSDVVLTQLVSTVKGTIGFLKKIDETVRVGFSDYELLEDGDGE